MVESKPIFVVDIDGVAFEFRKGKRVECASWLHIVTTIRANISILESILLSDVVLGLNHEIRDDFARRQ